MQSKRYNILVVDDEPTILNTVQAYLEQEGCSVDGAVGERLGEALLGEQAFQGRLGDIGRVEHDDQPADEADVFPVRKPCRDFRIRGVMDRVDKVEARKRADPENSRR